MPSPERLLPALTQSWGHRTPPAHITCVQGHLGKESTDETCAGSDTGVVTMWEELAARLAS